MLDSVAVACGDLLQNCGAVMLQGILPQCTSGSVTGIVSILCCVGRVSWTIVSAITWTWAQRLKNVLAH